MWWVGAKSIDVFLGSHAVGVALPNCEAVWLDSVDAANAWSMALQVASEHQSPTPLEIRVWLAATLARPFVLDAIPGLRSRAEALAVATSRCADLCGIAASCTVWLGPADADGRRLAVAVERELLDRLRSHCGLRLRLQGVSPWWTLALEAVLRRHHDVGVLAVDDGSGVVLLAGPATGFAIAANHPSMPDQQMQQLIQRARLSLSEPKLSGMQVRGGAALRHGGLSAGRDMLSLAFGAELLKPA